MGGTRRIEQSVVTVICFQEPHAPGDTVAAPVDGPLPPEPRRIEYSSSRTGKRNSSTSGSVPRVLVMWVWIAEQPSKSGPAPVPPQIVS